MTADALGLLALVLALGLRHGFDPDHLVAIDGFVRSSARRRPRVARWSGLFFSLGHGAVVTATAFAFALFADSVRAPAWLEPLGAWISIGVLTVLGMVNVAFVWRAPPGAVIAPVGLRARLFGDRLARASHPLVIAAIGAAFALSFDTLSNAILFSVTGMVSAGALYALFLGLVFTLGMAITDALNGWWVTRIVTSADRASVAASRCMSLAVAFLCFAIAATGFARFVAARIE